MNGRQATAVIVAAVAVVIVIACRPYYDNGGLIGGTVYYPFRQAPSSRHVSPNDWLLGCELVYIALTLLTALIALRARATRRESSVLIISLTAGFGWFLWQLPRFSNILGPESTWYALNLMAVIGLVVVISLSDMEPGRWLP
jgi:hypothetical protein